MLCNFWCILLCFFFFFSFFPVMCGTLITYPSNQNNLNQKFRCVVYRISVFYSDIGVPVFLQNGQVLRAAGYNFPNRILFSIIFVKQNKTKKSYSINGDIYYLPMVLCSTSHMSSKFQYFHLHTTPRLSDRDHNSSSLQFQGQAHANVPPKICADSPAECCLLREVDVSHFC